MRSRSRTGVPRPASPCPHLSRRGDAPRRSGAAPAPTAGRPRSDAADDVAQDRERQRPEPVQVPERRPGDQRGEHHDRVEDAVEQLPTGEQGAEQQRGHQAYAEALGRVLHAGHQRDDQAGQHGQAERTQVDAQLGVMGTGLDRGVVQRRERLHDQPGDSPPSPWATAVERGEGRRSRPRLSRRALRAGAARHHARRGETSPEDIASG